MAWTQAQLDALDKAIARGVRKVDYGDRSVTYHSVEEMLKLRERISDELAGTATSTRRRFSLGAHSKG